MSDSPPERDVEWTASGADAAWKHLQRVWRMADDIANDATTAKTDPKDALALEKATHRAIDEVTNGIEGFAFNKSVAALYQFTNTLAKSKADQSAKTRAMKAMAQMMQPMTPHLAEEIWSKMGATGLVTETDWPEVDPTMLVDDSITLPIQINGKRRGEIKVSNAISKEELEKLVMAHETVVKALDGNAPKKVIIVPGRIVNVVL
jgi:leucyl-tRNA synthetase